MKTLSAREAKNAFGLMIDTARAEPVLIEKHGRGVVMVIAVQEYERLTVRPMPEERQIGRSQGDNEVTNEASTRIKIDGVLKDIEWRRTDGLSVRHEYPVDDDGRADYAPFDRRGRALGAPLFRCCPVATPALS